MEITLFVAGMLFAITSDDTVPDILSSHYFNLMNERFGCTRLVHTPRFYVRITSNGGISLPVNMAKRRYGTQYAFEKGAHFYTTGSSSSCVNVENNTVLITIPGEICVDEGFKMFAGHLRNALSMMLMQRGGCLYHCAALVRDDRALLFSGESGSGKSTIAGILAADGWQLLNDECNALLPYENRAKVWATPFTSIKMQSVSINMSAVIEHVFYIYHAPVNKHEKLSGMHKILNNMAGLYVLPSDNDSTSLIMYNVHVLLKNIGACRLGFVNNRTIIPVINSFCRCNYNGNRN